MLCGVVPDKACAHDCPDTCATLVEVQDGRATRFYADPDHPVTRGWLCAKVRPYLDRVYHPDRVLYPLRRSGPKGSGRFERITWDEAIKGIARHIKDTRDRTFVTTDAKGNTVNRVDGIAFAGGATFSNEEGYLAAKVMRSLGLVYLEQQARV